MSGTVLRASRPAHRLLLILKSSDRNLENGELGANGLLTVKPPVPTSSAYLGRVGLYPYPDTKLHKLPLEYA